MALPHSLRAFRHRNFRLYFAGQGISQTGTWLQTIATSWLIYDLSGSYTPAFVLVIASALMACAAVWLAAPRKVRLVPGQAPRWRHEVVSV